MDNVVKFGKREKPEEPKPHIAGFGLCFKCKHEWAAVAPAGVHELECPNCTCRAVWRGLIGCRNDNAYVCNCGCWLYRIDCDGPFCIECGALATGWFK